MTTVTLLTAPACHLCDQAQKILVRVIEDYELTVETVPITTEQGRRLVAEHRVAFPPGVLIDGRTFSFGRLSERRLRRELERRKVPTPGGAESR